MKIFSVRWINALATSATMLSLFELYTYYHESLSVQLANVGQNSGLTFPSSDNSVEKLTTEINELTLEKRKLEEELRELESEIAQQHRILNSHYALTTSSVANYSARHRTGQINLPLPNEASIEANEKGEQKRIAILDNFLIDNPSRAGEKAGALDTIEGAAQTIELEGANINHLNCNDTICRIDAVFADTERINEIASLLVDRIGWNSALEIHVNSRKIPTDGNAKVTTIYLSRAGKELPPYSPTF